MADPLLLLAYGAAKFFEKKTRDEKAVAIAAQQKAEKEQEALAKTRVTPFGRTTPDGPIQKLSILDKNFANYEVTHRAFGNNEPKAVDPVEKSETLFEDLNGRIGTEAFFKGDIVKSFGQMGMLDDFKLRQAGVRTVKGEKFSDDIYTGFNRRGAAKAPKNLVVAEGIVDGKAVYAETVGELQSRFPKATNVAQKKVSPDFVAGLGFNAANLSPELSSFVPVPTEKAPEKTTMFFGTSRAGNEIQATSAAELKALDATDIFSSQVIQKGGEQVKVGSVTIFNPAKKDAEFEQLATVSAVGEDGTVSPIQTVIDIDEYRKDPQAYKIHRRFQRNKTTKAETTIDTPSMGSQKKAIDIAAGFYNVKIHSDFNKPTNERKTFYIGKDFKTPQSQLGVFRDFLRDLPIDRNGNINFSATGMSDQDIEKTVNYAAELIASNTTVKDPISGEQVPDTDLLLDEIAFLRDNFVTLGNIPGVEAAVKRLAGIKEEEVKRQVVAENSIASDGAAQSVAVAMSPVEVPATLLDPAASPNQTVRGKQPIAVPFPPKFNKTVDFVIGTLAADESPEQIQNATNSLTSLIKFERTADGRIKKSPTGQSIIAKDQPKLEFVEYLRGTTDTTGTPFFFTFQNMLKLGSQQKLMNPEVVSDIKLAISEVASENFEAGMSLISAFSPPVVGTKRDRLLWASQTGKSSRLFAKERPSRILQADSAANAVKNIDNMMETYFITGEDGQRQFIDLNTQLGQFYVSAFGMVHLAKKAIPGLVSISQSDAVSAARTTIFGNDRNGKKYFASIADNQLPQSEMLTIAKERGFSTVDKFLEAERAAATRNKEQYEKATEGLSSTNETVKNLALRNYYRYMVAYSMAAAIQGGTGGRTISDQDVENILRALKMTSITGLASTELEILTAAKEMLIEIEQHSRAVGDGGARAYAALKLQEFTLGRTGTNINIGDVTSRLEQNGTPDTVAPESAQMSDQEKLDKINAAQGKFADTYDTLEAAVKALGKNGVELLLSN